MTHRPALHALADRLGVESSFLDVEGVERHATDTGREAIIASMGWDGSSEAAAARSLEALEAARAARWLAPVVVVTRAEGRAPLLELPLPPGTTSNGSRVRWRLTIRAERGGVLELEARSARGLALRLPAELPDGYHELRLELDGAAQAGGSTTLVVAPRRCWTVGEAVGRRKVFGIWANLYGVRTGRDWGIGDLGTLAELATWTGLQGADFVGINPLHALRNRGHDISPYSPVSRLFRNPIYIDVEAVPELAECREARAWMESAAFAAELRALRERSHVDYERVRALKRPVLDLLHRECGVRHIGRATERGLAYTAYLERMGRALDQFATFAALDEHFTSSRGATWWGEWPEPYRDPRSPEVAAFRCDHATRIDFHRWLQFELDRQLRLAAEAGRAAGMEIGLYQDLAVGSSGGGSDAWAFGDLFSRGASVGAPPDTYAPQGQDWGLPPLDPHRLAETGYRYWIALLRSALEHGGALRVDHAMGLRRLYWIPRGLPATDGAYVRYPERELFAILALESRRRKALVVAEDLGTVPEGFEEALAAAGILSSRVLYFERDAAGEFRASKEYSRRALVTTTTHDHIPLAGFMSGRDIELRRELNLFDDESYARARDERAGARRELLRRLARERLLPGEPGSTAALTAAVHRFLARTPAPLLGLSLDDLAGETDPVNVPGVGPDRFPVWARRQRKTLEELRGDPDTSLALSGAASRRRPRR